MTIRVLIVDDSPTMRGVIAARLRADTAITVIGHAAGPLEARQAIKTLNPDVVTLDIEMPGMDGLEFLDKIMRLRPTPVVMISSLTQRGADATLRALEIGAFDCIAKPSPAAPDGFDRLTEVVKAAAAFRPRPRTLAPAPQPDAADFQPDGRIVAIGASTGGVEALIAVLSRFPANCPPTIVTQHMPPSFTRSFAQRLNRLCAPTVAEAADGARLLPGTIHLAPGDHHLTLSQSGPLRCRLNTGPKVNGHRPSADVMFASVLRAVGQAAIGVILTGMGRDGAEELLALRQAGCETIGQDEATSIVYGMPRVAFELGAISRQLPLAQIGDHIIRMANSQRHPARTA
ncbi:protein-glutamate methylesterase/protein-glutamine glutaminase [Acidisoma silvae]|uniref:Protein-glutamate methylesterase/protein-glutamine glutaminase n=1 Tax=Acidisoma silvae TaxID=2802396 RepID=A0A963YRE7_9PROT|nr:chemotaxis response regulator protein-glutamate methylesterase [Acidisoma silvae]MCB8874940.1 chemotaxis response regulator protein-glutamate methylesterase [Acidisoma silvae]